MRQRSRGLAATAAIIAASAIAAGPAQAQTTIGQTPAIPSNQNCGSNLPFVQALTGGEPGYEVPPGNWLMTSWSHQAGAASGQLLKLTVFRPVGDPSSTTTFEVVAEDGPRPLVQNNLNIFDLTTTPIPVQGGDLLGLVAKSSAAVSPVNCQFNTAVPGDVYRVDLDGGDLGPGATMIADASQAGSRLNVSATLKDVQSNDTAATES